MSWRRHLTSTAVGILISTLAAASAGASTGAGVAANPIVLPGHAHPGQSATLPGLYIVNTGTVDGTYVARVQRLGSAKGLYVPPSWVRFERNGVQLAPGASATLPMRLVVPADARLGYYGSDLIVATVGPGRVGSTAVGAAAATELHFTVAADGGGGGLPGGATLWIAVGAVALLGAAVWGWRRSGIRLRVERR